MKKIYIYILRTILLVIPVSLLCIVKQLLRLLKCVRNETDNLTEQSNSYESNHHCL